MKATNIAKGVIGSVLIIHGVVWSIMFPKSWDLLKPDFVLSVGIGVGSILSGVLTLYLTRVRLWATFFGAALLWSLVFNAFLCSTVMSQHKSYVTALEKQHNAIVRLTKKDQR